MATPTVEAVKPSPPVEKRARTVSGVSYPYFDNDASLRVGEVVQNVAGGSAAPDFLAAKLGYKSTRSGTFLTRVSAARLFGYVATSNGNFVVTERGRAALSPVMPDDAINAKMDAFMGVPLFAKLYQDFNGRQLPPDVGLRNLFLNTYKIVPDRVDDALRVFQRSAEQCGFFQHGRDRLIKPSAGVSLPQQASAPLPANNDPPPPPAERQRSGGGGGDSGGGIHSAVIGLLRELPKQDESWTERERDDFLAAFTALVKFIFPAKKGETDGA